MHPRKKHSHKRVHAGAHRLAARASRGDRIRSDVKVKAHLTVSADMDSTTIRHIRGNEQADEHAKAAHELQPQFLRGEDAARRTQREGDDDGEMRAVCRTIAFVLGGWPKPDPRRRIEPEGTTSVGAKWKRRKAQCPVQLRHKWVVRNGMWCCGQCLTYERKDSTQLCRYDELCIGSHPALTSVIAGNKGHELVFLADSEGASILLCKCCGAFATKRPAKLLMQCGGVAPVASYGGQALRRVEKGKHPSHAHSTLISSTVHVDRAIASDAMREFGANVAVRFAHGAANKNRSRIPREGYAKRDLHPQDIARKRGRTATDQERQRINDMRTLNGRNDGGDGCG